MNHNEDRQTLCESCKVCSKYLWPFSASYQIIQRTWTRRENHPVSSFNFTSTSSVLWGGAAENTAWHMKHYFVWVTKSDPKLCSLAPEDLQCHILSMNSINELRKFQDFPSAWSFLSSADILTFVCAPCLWYKTSCCLISARNSLSKY